MKQVYRGDGDDAVYFDHGGIKSRSAKAKCLIIKGQDIWIPNSVIEDINEEVVAIKKWFVDKNGMGEGDW